MSLCSPEHMDQFLTACDKLEQDSGRHHRNPPGLLSALDMNHETHFFTNACGVRVDTRQAD